MSKFNKVLSVILVVCVLFGASNIIVSAATGDSIVTTVKNIVDKWFVNGQEVTENEFNSVSSLITYEDIIIEHHITTSTQYQINGKTVTEDEYNNYLKSSTVIKQKKTTNSTITFDSRDLTGLNSGVLGKYLYFDTDNFGNLVGAQVKSDSVVSVTFTYNESTYITYTTKNNGEYLYTASDYGNIYQDINEDGYIFKYGQATTTGFYVCDEDYKNTFDVETGDYIFRFVNTDGVKSIDFADVFTSITLNLAE